MSRYIKETTRPHSASTVEGLAGSGAGGGLLTIPRPWLIPEQGFEIAHVYVSGGVIYDRFTAGINQKSGWQVNGPLPLTGPAVLQGCDGRRTVEGMFVNGGVSWLSDPLNRAVFHLQGGDFVGAMISTTSVSDGDGAGGDSNVSNVGWFLGAQATGITWYDTTNTIHAIAGAVSFTNAPNVLCFGRAGNTMMVRANGTFNSLTGTGTAIAPSTIPMRVGQAPNGSGIRGGTVYEFWMSLVTPSAALFQAIEAEVKGRLGITAW